MTQRIETMEFTTIDKGLGTPYHQGGIVQILSREEWQKLWQVHKPSEDVPDVDFEQYLVVGLFTGNVPGGAQSMEIKAIEIDAQKLLSFKIEYMQVLGGKSGGNPYHIIQFPYRME